MGGLIVLILAILQDKNKPLSVKEIQDALYLQYEFSISSNSLYRAMDHIATFKADLLEVTTERIGEKRTILKKYKYKK